MMLNWELLGVLLLSCTQILSEYRGGEFYGPRNQYGGHRGGYNNNNNNNPNSNNNYHVARTREVQIKYGRLRGTVVQPRGDNLQLVDVFLGQYDLCSLSPSYSLSTSALLSEVINNSPFFFTSNLRRIFPLPTP